jgi:hypothetical protein
VKRRNKIDVNLLHAELDNTKELLDIAHQLIEKQKSIIAERDNEIEKYRADKNT